jgi:hypothetical protein
MNQSERRPIDHYYTPKLREMVTRHSPLVARFDYSYPGETIEATGLSEQDVHAGS